MPHQGLLHPKPLPLWQATADTQTLKGKSGSVSVGFPGAHKVLFEPSKWRIWGLVLNTISPLLSSSWASPLHLDMRYLFLVGSNILLSMVTQQ